MSADRFTAAELAIPDDWLVRSIEGREGSLRHYEQRYGERTALEASELRVIAALRELLAARATIEEFSTDSVRRAHLCTLVEAKRYADPQWRIERDRNEWVDEMIALINGAQSVATAVANHPEP